MRVEQVNPAIAELQRLRPAKLRVHTRDSDQPSAVAIPPNRKRWERLAKTLDGLDWIRIEALDNRGNIIGVVAGEEPEPQLGDVLADAGDELDSRVERMVRVMISAQQVALSAQAAQQKPLMEGVQRLMATMTDALGAVAATYKLALSAASAIPAPAGGGGDDADASAARFMQFVMMMIARGQQSGPQAVIEATKAASDVARDRQKSQDRSRPAPPASSASAPGPRAP